MITIERNDYRVYFQGDVMLRRVEEIPADVKKLDTEIIAHSETGHHHVAKYASVLGGLDPMVMFLKADGKHVDIEHRREFNTHETYRFLSEIGDCFEIKRQRETTPEGWKRVED